MLQLKGPRKRVRLNSVYIYLYSNLHGHFFHMERKKGVLLRCHLTFNIDDILIVRVLAWFSMCWCAAPCPLTAPASSPWGTGCSPADSGSHFSCQQVTLSQSLRPLGEFITNYFIGAECESLIRRILVLDPLRRYTIQQIKEHPWMQAEVNLT